MPERSAPAPHDQAAAPEPSGPFVLDERELEERFVCAPGPGGQNVNKVAAAVELRFDIRRSRMLSPDVKERLMRLGGRRVSSEGVLVIHARRFRTRERNRADARGRLLRLIALAAVAPRPRIATKPTLASRKRRAEAKKKKALVKRLRQAPSGGD